MKKFIILASVLAISMTSVFATETATISTTIKTTKDCPCAQNLDGKPCPKFVKHKIDLDKRLNLTEAQKKKARLLRTKSHEKIKPIMAEIGQKRQELANLDKENLADIEREKKAEKLISDIAKLDKKAHDLRIKNMKDFEKILTPEQKQELAKIKAEGRREFERNHPKQPPFGMPGFGRSPFGPTPIEK